MSSDPSTPNSPRLASGAASSGGGSRVDESASSVPLETRALLQRNLKRVQDRIESCAASAGVPPPVLVAVTKTVNPDATAALVDAGASELGENRAAPFAEKADSLEAQFARSAGEVHRWHFIGHLQRNKARRVLERAHVLHSVDTPRLAESIARIAAELRRTIEVFVEVNLTGEAQKHGHAPGELGPTLDVLAASPWIRVLGLMAMGPLVETEDVTTESVFSCAGSLARALESERGPSTFHEGRCRLSMGMSGDLEVAIRNGATHVRVGSALFEGLDETHRR